MWLGDYTEDHATVTCMFTTHSSTGAPVAPSTALENADVLIYKNGNAAQKTSTNGVTMTSPFDSVTGLHCLVIDTSNDTGDSGFWVAGAVYTLVLSPDETVDGIAVAKVIGQFGIELAGALRPTTASRKLDVSAGGEAGLDWANVGSPTTSLNLSGTTIATTQKVDVDTIKTNPVVNGGTLTFPNGATLASTTNITAGTVTTATNVTTVNGLAANVVTAASIADGAIDAATFASGALDAVWSTGTRVLTAGTNIQLPSNGLANVTAWTVAITGNITGNLSGSVGSVSGNIGGNVVGSIGSLATQAKADVNAEADTALSDAGVTTTVTGRIDAAISTRLASGSYTAPDNATISAIAGYVDTEVAAIKAKTDLIPGTIDGKTFSELVTLIAAVLLGKSSRPAPGTRVYRAIDDSKDRVTADAADGDRTAVTLDAA